MRKFQCLLFVLKRFYICYYIICMTVPLKHFFVDFDENESNIIAFIDLDRAFDNIINKFAKHEKRLK